MPQNSNPLGFNNRKSLDDYENYDISEEHHKKINIDMQDILNHSDNDIEFDIENIQELKDDLYDNDDDDTNNDDNDDNHNDNDDNDDNNVELVEEF